MKFGFLVGTAFAIRGEMAESAPVAAICQRKSRRFIGRAL
jgi:hypothetical protein